MLSLTSVATRTSPVFRGKYVLATFLNTPPPPPPPNVPTLDDSNKEAGAAVPKTVREQLERHRQNPACASCHRIIDPVGFALEQFNSVGQWRIHRPRRLGPGHRRRAGGRDESGWPDCAAQRHPEQA